VRSSPKGVPSANTSTAVSIAAGLGRLLLQRRLQPVEPELLAFGIRGLDDPVGVEQQQLAGSRFSQHT
jgi:hypothetical protein